MTVRGKPSASNVSRGQTIVARVDGFTLLEVLVATMVLGISVVIVLQLFSGGLDQARRAEDYTRAVFHARAKMEEVLLDLPSGEAEYSIRIDLPPWARLAPRTKSTTPDTPANSVWGEASAAT